MPCSLSLGESWQLETHSLRAQMSGIRLWHSWLGIVEPSNGARSWMFEGKSRLQMFPNRCNRFLPLHCSTYRTVYSSPVVTAGPPPTIRERIALSPRSLSNTRMRNCTALKHIFMQEFYCSRFRMPKTADFDKVVIRGKHEYV